MQTAQVLERAASVVAIVAGVSLGTAVSRAQSVLPMGVFRLFVTRLVLVSFLASVVFAVVGLVAYRNGRTETVRQWIKLLTELLPAALPAYILARASVSYADFLTVTLVCVVLYTVIAPAIGVLRRTA